MSREVLDQYLNETLAKYQILYNELTFHSHNAHHLVSLHLLGATDEQLGKAYENMCKDLDPYQPSPEPITIDNWRQFLGNENFCQSYRDFFQDQLKSHGDDWQKRFWELLLDHPESPMINGLVCGLAHPLIHVGYAIEMNSLPIGIEALALTAVCYNYHHEIVDQLKPPTTPSKSVMKIFKEIHFDKNLPIYEKPGVSNLRSTVKNCFDIVMSYYNQWKFDRNQPEKNIEELFDFSVYIFGATHKTNQIEFDFFLLHLLTSMHAIRTVYPHVKDENLFEHILYQYLYFGIVIYISQLRPEINERLIDEYPMEKNWNYVIEKTLSTKLSDDAHAVKVVRVLRDAEQIYGSKNDFYLRTAVKIVDHLNIDDLWVGGGDDERQINVLKL